MREYVRPLMCCQLLAWPCPGLVVRADNLDVLGHVPDGSVDLVYVDPPFNTGRRQTRAAAAHRPRRRPATARASGARATARRASARAPSPTPSTTTSPSSSRASSRRTASSRPTGSFYLHLDYREVHYAKVLADAIFGRDALHQRDRLGLRLRRAHAPPLARQARRHPRLREGPGRVLLRRRRRRPHPVHGARPRRRRRRRRAASCPPTRGGTPS